MDLKILQCNVQSLFKNKAEILRIMSGEDLDIGILSEVWTSDENVSINKYKISGYHTITDSRNDGYGGAAVLVSTNYNYKSHKLPATSDMTQAVCVEVLSKNVTVLSVYISPSIHLDDFEKDCKALIDFSEKFSNIIIGGDFNAHHQAWGDERCDCRGKVLADIVDAAPLIICNDGSPTFVPVQMDRRSSAIDITLCTPSLYQSMEWKVSDWSIGSHHMAIKVSFGYSQHNRTNVHVNRREVLRSIATLDVSAVKHVEDLMDRNKEIIKRNKFKTKRVPKYWWSEDVDQAWRDKSEARRAFNRQSSLENLLMYKKKAATFQRLKREEIRKKFEGLPDEIGPFSTSKELWQKVGMVTGHKRRRRENNVLFDDRKAAESFLDTHFEKCNTTIEGSYGKVVEYPLLTRDTWKNIVSTKKKKSAPGVDLISYETLRSLSPEVTDVIIGDLNNMWFRGTISDALKVIKIVPVPKPGRDQTLPEGKRPISLVSTITKVANTAVLHLLQHFLEENKIIPDTSFGFRRHMSTITCVSYLINEIKAAKRGGQVVALIAIDLSNAFNAVKTDKLGEILSELRVPNEVQIWIESFLKNRRLQMAVRSGVIERIVSNGLPQGDVMSPTLFNVYTLGFHAIVVEDVILVQYADDFGVLVKARSLDEINKKAQLFLDNFRDKAEELNLKINAEKTKAVLFQANNKQLSIKINGQAIETVRSIKHLGVHFDRTLSFGVHIRELGQKLRDRQNVLKVLSGIKHGSHPQVMIRLYEALIRSVTEYGCTAFNNASKSNLKKLETVNNQCLRKANGLTKTTPLNVLHAISGQDQIKVRLEYVSGREICRAMHRNNIVAKQLKALNRLDRASISDEAFTFMEYMYLEHQDVFDSISPVNRITLNREIQIQSTLEGITSAKKEISDRVFKQAALCAMNGKYSTRGRIFTDASKEGNRCAVGIYVENTRQRFSIKLAYETSITSAEILAISEAAQIVERQQLLNYVIYTDSKSSLIMLNNVIEQREGDSVLVRILETAQKWNIDFQWIPSHVNISGNEIADSLAKNGLTRPFQIVRNPRLLKDAQNYLKKCKAEATNKWYQEYSLDKGRKFYDVFGKFEYTPWFKGLELKGRQVRLLNRLISGHDFSNYWLNKMKIVESGECDMCDESETAEHLILHCPKYGMLRSEYDFDGLYGSTTEMFKTVIETKNLKMLEQIVDFCKKAKINL